MFVVRLGIFWAIYSSPPLFVTLVLLFGMVRTTAFNPKVVSGMRGMIREVNFPAFEQHELDGKGAPLVMQLALHHFRLPEY